MKNEYQYILENNSKKYLCPDCGQKNFVRYIDTYTGKNLPEIYGRCDREINCAYHINPYTDGYVKLIKNKDHSNQSDNWKPPNSVLRQIPNPDSDSYIPVEIFKQSRKGYEQNYFVQWLTGLFNTDIAGGLISRYYIGTSKRWKGATVFWQIDCQGRIRSGKIMLYSPTTGKRVKTYIDWVHTTLTIPEFNLKQCFFGEHLLKQDLTSPVGIVESEKTAIVASVYLPHFVWLATGSLSNLNVKKCRSLKGRNVYLFPDLNCFEEWSKKAQEISELIHETSFEVSDLLECTANKTDKVQGLDLADYLIKHDWLKFRTQFTEPMQKQKIVEQIHPETLPKQNSEKGENSEPVKTNYFSHSEPFPQIEFLEAIKSEQPENWGKEISLLESFFNGIQLPTEPIKLKPYNTIIDVSKFLESHFAIVKAQNGKLTYLPYLNQLQELKKFLSTSIN